MLELATTRFPSRENSLSPRPNSITLENLLSPVDKEVVDWNLFQFMWIVGAITKNNIANITQSPWQYPPISHRIDIHKPKFSQKCLLWKSFSSISSIWEIFPDINM